MKGSTVGRKTGCSTRICLIPWNEEATQVVCFRGGDGTGGREGLGGEEGEWGSEAFHLLCCPTCFSSRFGWQAFRKCLMRLGPGIMD